MQIEKKTIIKEDGRYLVAYHFPDSATPEESAVFAAIDDAQTKKATETPQANAAPQEETARV